jgi:ATP-dependent RNA helicase RhlE
LKSNPDFAKVLLFVSTKKMADDVFERLAPLFPDEVGIIHSNKSQNNRFENLRQFNNNTHRMLIATDIVARGLDFDDVTHVVNFDIPEIPESYMHRIGRTGRADKKGVALAFITKADAESRVSIEELMGQKIKLMKLPEEVEISKELTEDELPKVVMKNTLVKIPKKEEGGEAFHEKKDKNKKVNMKVRRAEAMKIKYKKPKTRGQKKKK